jgi:hypothetical protein
MLIRHYFSFSSSEPNNSHPKQTFFEEQNVTVGSDIWHRDLPVTLANNALFLSYNTHVFYYPWYGNLEDDSRYLHWK